MKMMYTHLSEELSHEYVTFTFYKFGPHTILCIIPTQFENLIWMHSTSYIAFFLVTHLDSFPNHFGTFSVLVNCLCP